MFSIQGFKRGGVCGVGVFPSGDAYTRRERSPEHSPPRSGAESKQTKKNIKYDILLLIRNCTPPAPGIGGGKAQNSKKLVSFLLSALGGRARLQAIRYKACNCDQAREGAEGAGDATAHTNRKIICLCAVCG